MGKYDEFDLDIKQDKNLDIVNPRACTEFDLYSCATITIEISKAIDCFSKDGQCSGVISDCSPCGSGYRGIARC
ncbi:hypothetical protein [Lutispora sp.]|uniref:hypothetical protein n=1 Tax=Lutispora sp. TaxID=2828727 RepID=UPI002B22040D|nr:hypothetical protein [Lutispora sp.]MEA4962650.1 hypothetical protein [Lutispora sp.]